MAQAENQMLPERSVALWRGFRGICPNCGKGRLFKSYLAQNDLCPVCHENYSDIHADDGPAWFVMLLTGAIVVPAAVYLSVHDVMPEWAVMALLIVLTVVLAYLALPRAKGIFIALLWHLARKSTATPHA